MSPESKAASVRHRIYEGMFLVDPLVASQDWNRITEHIERTITRYGGKVLRIRKWGERRLAYPIQKKQRGTYVLAYFQTPTNSLPAIRGDLHLSELVLRFLLLQAEASRVEEAVRGDVEPKGIRSSRSPKDAEGKEG